VSATTGLLVELPLKPWTCIGEQSKSDLLHTHCRYSQSFFTVEMLYLWDGVSKFRCGSGPGIKEMPVAVKLLKSDQLPEFWGKKTPLKPCGDPGGQHITSLKTISILQPLTFPLCG